jgi:hypothetical protein
MKLTGQPSCSEILEEKTQPIYSAGYGRLRARAMEIHAAAWTVDRISYVTGFERLDMRLRAQGQLGSQKFIRESGNAGPRSVTSNVLLRSRIKD